ncbi:MAG: hypothetical protein QNJ68_02100 [Microcoleaceae cyanobacterium MO_207.B10]|nr:hypothetical protein [Microcoleaceae cyanobacterium MO_207.B10]
MTWLKLTKKALQLKKQNSTIEEVKVESYPDNSTEDWIEEFPTRWFEGEDAPKTMIISNNEYEPQSIEKGAIQLKILYRLEELYPGSDVSEKLKELSQKSGVDLSVLTFYSTQPISKEKLKEPSTKKQLDKICSALDCNIDTLEKREVDLPLFKFDIDFYIRKKYKTEADFIQQTGTSAELIDLLRTQYVDIYLITGSRTNDFYSRSNYRKVWCKYCNFGC